MKEFQLEADKGHMVQCYDYGNPDGPVILNFHGGPGSGSKPHHAERFDLSKYRVILFDQRGCGKSTPLGDIENNTTEDLLSDADRIREKLGIDKWFVAGSSWGSTLALLYAIKFPENVRGLLVSAIWFADHNSLSWAMVDSKGVARLMPDVWAKRMEFFKKFGIRLETQSADLLQALESADQNERKEIVAGIINWESNLFSTQSDVKYKNPEDITPADMASAKIFIHYDMNNEFIPDDYIANNLAKIAHIPAVITHGRFDILCPIEKAFILKDKLDDCEMYVAASSGHMLSPEGETIRKMAHNHFLENKLVVKENLL